MEVPLMLKLLLVILKIDLSISNKLLRGSALYLKVILYICNNTSYF